jgi:hypothetical protein
LALGPGLGVVTASVINDGRDGPAAIASAIRAGVQYSSALCVLPWDTFGELLFWAAFTAASTDDPSSFATAVGLSTTNGSGRVIPALAGGHRLFGRGEPVTPLSSLGLALPGGRRPWHRSVSAGD